MIIVSCSRETLWNTVTGTRYSIYNRHMMDVLCFFSRAQACLVHTTETIRVRYFMDRLLERRRPVMLVGNAGTGKSVLVGDKLGSLDSEKYMIKNVPFNYYTTSAMLQGRNPTFVVRHTLKLTDLNQRYCSLRYSF